MSYTINELKADHIYISQYVKSRKLNTTQLNDICHKRTVYAGAYRFKRYSKGFGIFWQLLVDGYAKTLRLDGWDIAAQLNWISHKFETLTEFMNYCYDTCMEDCVRVIVTYPDVELYFTITGAEDYHAMLAKLPSGEPQSIRAI